MFEISKSVCHGWNVELENPPTHKRQDCASTGNFDMDATPKYYKKNKNDLIESIFDTYENYKYYKILTFMMEAGII